MKRLSLERISSFARRHFWKSISAVALTYLVCSTFLWHWLWSFVIGLAWEITQLGKAEDERDYFRTYAAEQPTINALCDFGNLVIDTFQPMVSDAVLIDHWKKHREGMERVAQMTARKQPDYSDFSKPEHVKALHEVGVTRIFRGEYAISIQPFPKLGKHQHRYFCGYPGYRKQLVYYTGDYLPVEINGRMLARPSKASQEGSPDSAPNGAMLLNSTDAISTFRNESLVRRLNERWYIWR